MDIWTKRDIDKPANAKKFRQHNCGMRQKFKKELNDGHVVRLNTRADRYYYNKIRVGEHIKTR